MAQILSVIRGLKTCSDTSPENAWCGSRSAECADERRQEALEVRARKVFFRPAARSVQDQLACRRRERVGERPSRYISESARSQQHQIPRVTAAYACQ